MEEWNLNYTDIQWTFSAFLIAMGISVPLSAWIISRYSTRTILWWALGIISVGLFIDTISPSYELLIAGRVLEGLGGGLIPAVLFWGVLKLVPPSRHGFIIALCGAVLGLGPSLSPLWSGILLSFQLSWRYLFVGPLIVSLLLLVCLPWCVYDLSPHSKKPIDGISALESIISFPSILAGCGLLSAQSSSSRWIGGLLCVGGILLFIAWGMRQYRLSVQSSLLSTHILGRHNVVRAFLRGNSPLINMTPITSSCVWSTLIIIFLLQSANMALVIIYPLAIQKGFQLSSFQASLLLIIPLVLSQIWAIGGGRLLDWKKKSSLTSMGSKKKFSRVYTKRTWQFSAMGIVLILIGFAVLGIQIIPHNDSWIISGIGAFITFIGIASLFPAIQAYAYSSVKPHHFADIATMIQTIMQVGAAIGALVTAVLFQYFLNIATIQKMSTSQSGNMASNNMAAHQELIPRFQEKYDFLSMINNSAAHNPSIFALSLVSWLLCALYGICVVLLIWEGFQIIKTDDNKI